MRDVWCVERCEALGWSVAGSVVFGLDDVVRRGAEVFGGPRAREGKGRESKRRHACGDLY